GHRVYRNGDPRAKHLKHMSKELTKVTEQTKWYNMSDKIEDYIKEEKGLPANVDFYSASVYYSIVLDHDLYTSLFAVSRAPGWSAHIVEQYYTTRMISPRAEYTGTKTQDYIATANRG